MPPTVLDPLNAPPDNIASPAAYYKWKTKRVAIAADAAGASQIMFMPYTLNWANTVIMFSDRTKCAKLEASISSNDIINGKVEDVSAIWKEIAVSADIVTLTYPVVALRFTSVAGQAMSADILP